MNEYSNLGAPTSTKDDCKRPPKSKRTKAPKLVKDMTRDEVAKFILLAIDLITCPDCKGRWKNCVKCAGDGFLLERKKSDETNNRTH